MGPDAGRPATRRLVAKRAPELGARETEEQGFAGNRAPSLRRTGAEKAPGLGVKETEEQGFAGNRAPSPRRPGAKNNKKRENTRSLRVHSAFVGSCRQSIFPRFR